MLIFPSNQGKFKLSEGIHIQDIGNKISRWYDMNEAHICPSPSIKMQIASV